VTRVKYWPEDKLKDLITLHARAEAAEYLAFLVAQVKLSQSLHDQLMPQTLSLTL
jgi:hypothetical protein